MDPYDREYDELERQLADGEISEDEFKRKMRDLQHSYRAAAEESAEQAYQDELDRW